MASGHAGPPDRQFAVPVKISSLSMRLFLMLFRGYDSRRNMLLQCSVISLEEVEKILEIM